MIEIQSLSCGYGERKVLHQIDLTVREGEMVGILGPNGSGKTTLLLAISGILPAQSGTVRVAGSELKAVTSHWCATRIASVPQHPTISFPFKCLSVVLMGRYPHLSRWGEYTGRDMDVALDVMEETNTLHLAQRPIDHVSGGEAQMIMISRALAQETEVLLLDEATSSLDVSRKIQIFDLLGVRNRKGSTVLCVMHDLNLSALYCERLVFLKQGVVVSDGPTEEIFNDHNLSRIYETDIRVAPHPVTGRPQAHFVPGRGGLPVEPAGRHAEAFSRPA
jgi:iron complex transport system ATP-binding protein